MAFELPEVTQLHCVHVSPRRELHGEEHVPAIDLTFRMQGGNELLNLIDPSIRTALYFNAAADHGQETLPDVLVVLPNLRAPKLNAGKFSWAKGEKHKGYRFVQDFGLGGESSIDLDDCTVHGWTFETKEGGSVVLDFKVSYAGEKLNADVRGRLTGLIDETVFVQLIAPPMLQIVKSSKHKAKVSDGEEAGSLIDEEEEGDLDPESPEGAFAATAG